MVSRNRILWGGMAVALLALGLLALPRQRHPAAAAAHFVGSNACVSCHSTQVAEWRQSQHQAAMAQATERTVLGDFHDATFRYAGITSVFFQRAGKVP